MKIEIVKADYQNSQHAAALVSLLDGYARDAMGGGKGLTDEVKESLIPKLAQRPTAFSVLAFADGEPAGLINCFEGFSTFAAKPLVNVHDVAVAPQFRRLGIAQMMLGYAEEIARDRGCCKLTLEVLSHNTGAQDLYLKLGYNGYQPDKEAGLPLFFWQKRLSA